MTKANTHRYFITQDLAEDLAARINKQGLVTATVDNDGDHTAVVLEGHVETCDYWIGKHLAQMGREKASKETAI